MTAVAGWAEVLSHSKALIVASVPRGMRRTPDQQTFLRALREDPDVLALRYDGYGNLIRVAQVIAWAADWSTMCSRPTIAGIVERTGLSKATVKRWIRWLREHGWLGVVEQGSTVRFRKGTSAGLDADGLGNRAALWVICIPRDIKPVSTDRTSSEQAKCVTDPPSVSLPERDREGPTRTREAPRRARRNPRISPTWGLHESPRNKRDRLAACERLRQESNVLRHMTPWYLRWLLRPYLVAGWTAADVLHALDVRPDDSRWTYTWSSVAELRHIPGWVRHRLASWLDEDGQVLPSRSQRLAELDERRRAEQAERRRAWAWIAASAGVELEEGDRLSRAKALAPPPILEGPVDEDLARHGAALVRRLFSERPRRRNGDVERWKRADAAAAMAVGQRAVEDEAVMRQAGAGDYVDPEERKHARSLALARARARAERAVPSRAGPL